MMKTMRKWVKRGASLLAVLVLGVTMTGCPFGAVNPQVDYDLGFAAGFLKDDYYWSGFWDSYDTLEYEPVYWSADQIPYVDGLNYDAGYYDGLWYAYNDGYFTDYRYAFILGFSEGYDAAFYPDYLDFLAGDVHVENLNGGWGDGYNDGFSEGRVFGAFDYEDGRAFDWADALLDYEGGTDLYFDEVDVGTGEFGPVYLYEYGVDPFTLKIARIDRRIFPKRATPALRKASSVDDQALFRPLTDEAKAALDVLETAIPRNAHEVRYQDTRLERLNSYLSLSGSKSEVLRVPRARS